MQLKWVIHAPKLIRRTLRDEQDVQTKNASWLDAPLIKHFPYFPVFKDTDIPIKHDFEGDSEFKDSSSYSNLPYLVC